MLRREGWLLTAVLVLVTAGCVSTAPKERVAAKELVYPAAPDEPRFVFERSIVSSADVVPAEEESALKYLLTGQVGTAEGFGKPYAVAVHKGRVFVSDSASRAIKVLDIAKGSFFNLGEEDIAKPLGLDVDKDGKVYVADATQKTVLIFDRDGKLLSKIGDAKTFDRLTSVTVDRDGERVYVVDIGGVQSQNHRVRVFNAKTGEHLMDIGKRGTGPGELNLPRDLAIGKEGRLYVSDGGNFRVNIYDRDGKFVKSFGSVGKQVGSFARPKELATDAEGNVYIADTAFGNFQIFSPDGELLMFVGERSEQNGPGKYMLPSGIFVDEDGRVYFVDQWFKKVDVYRPYKLKANEGFAVYRKEEAKKGAGNAGGGADKK